MRLASFWRSCTVVSLLQWNSACDILMTLAITRIHNLPPHLSYVSTLPDIQKTETSWSRGSLTLGTVFLGHHRRSEWQTWLHVCVTAKGRHFEHLYCALATQPAQSYFRHIETGSLQSHSHYWKEDNIILPFLSASLYFSKRGAYWDRLCCDVVGRWLVVTRVHCGQTVHPRPIVTMEH